MTGRLTNSYAYDALGRRFSRTAGGTTTTFLSAGSAIVLEKQGASTTAAYTYGNSLIRKDSEVPLYDGLGAARGQTNAGQVVTSTLTPDAFGQTVAASGSTSSRYGYAGDWGYRSDGDAGLLHPSTSLRAGSGSAVLRRAGGALRQPGRRVRPARSRPHCQNW